MVAFNHSQANRSPCQPKPIDQLEHLRARLEVIWQSAVQADADDPSDWPCTFAAYQLRKLGEEIYRNEWSSLFPKVDEPQKGFFDE